MTLPPDPMYEVQVHRGADLPYVLYNKFTDKEVMAFPTNDEASDLCRYLNDKMRGVFRGGNTDTVVL